MHFATLDSNTGLSQNTVFAIAQDAEGFIWIGTEQGLNRYDGYAIEQLHRESGGGSGLDDSFIFDLAVDGAGGLWIATARGGLSYREPGQPQPRPQPLVLPDGGRLDTGTRALHVDAGNRLWIGTLGNGVLRFDPATDTLAPLATLVDNPPASLSELNVYAFAESAAGELWIATDQGLLRANLDQRSLTLLPDDPETGLPGKAVRELLLLPDGELWIATLGQGLGRTRDQGGSWTQWLPEKASPSGTAGGQQPSSSRINTLFQDQAGRLWLGTDTGLNHYDIASNSFRYYRKNNLSSGLADNDILRIFQDHTGLLWFGTRAGGVSTWHPRSWELGHERPGWSQDTPVTSFATVDGATYIGTLGGGIVEQQGTRKRFIGAAQGLTDARVMALASDLQEQLWIGTMTGGLFSLAAGASAVTPFTPTPTPTPTSSPAAPSADATATGASNPLAGAGIMSLLLAPSGNLWIGTYERGLWLINPYTRTLIAAGEDRKPLLSGLQILSLTAAGRGGIWAGTNRGLFLVHPHRGVVAQFQHDPNDPASISADTIYSTHADSTGQLWIGTSDGGLNRLQGSAQAPERVRFERYAPQQLKAHSIYGIESDDSGQLWLATNNGLLQMDPNDGTSRVFGPADGAQDREYNFGAHHRARNGMLYFGGRNGYNAFDPADLELEPAAAQITLLEFEPRGELPIDLRAGGRDAAPLTLTYVQNAFTIRFALLDYGSPDGNTFSYRLVGFDRDWSSYTADHSATYTNLDPGSYRFEVRARSSSSVAGSGIGSFELTINPPPWATTTAYGVYAALLLLIFGIVIRQLRQREARRRAYQAQLEREVAERTVELEDSNRQLAQATRAKSDFLARMSHEIRTPMNGVFGTAELLLRSPLASRQKQQVNIIHKSCGALISLINDILDFSKIEAGKLTLEALPFDLMDVVHEVGQLFVHQAQQKSLQLFINSSCLTLPVVGDPLRLRQVISNLVGNAIKFTEHGYVELEVEQRSDNIAIAVRDTGIGIAPEAQRHIFEDFSQADGSTSRRFGGTGLGLSICGQLAELMGGRIALTSEPGQGSTFTALLPLPRAGEVPDRPTVELDVLVLVSHPRQAEILQAVLGSCGARVIVASDVDDASAVRTPIQDIDALICDPLSSIGLDQWLAQVNVDRAQPLRIVTIGDCAFDSAQGSTIISLNAPAAPGELVAAVTASTAQETPADAALPQITLTGELLLVEDNPVNQEVIVGMLETLGITPLIANDGPTALKLCRTQPFQIVLLDCGLPGMDGFEVTRTLRAETGPNQQTTIVALTANSLSGERENCLAAGMDDFLAKPCTLIDLARTLTRWVDPAGTLELAPAERSTAAANDNQSTPSGGPLSAERGPARDDSRIAEIDLSALMQIYRLEQAGRTGMLDLLIKMYQADLQTALGQLQEPETLDDPSAVRSLAHKLKSSSANVGALTYAEYWAALESACAEGRADDQRAALAQLVAHQDAVLEAVANAARNLAESA